MIVSRFKSILSAIQNNEVSEIQDELENNGLVVLETRFHEE